MWCKSAAVGWVNEHLQRTCYVDSFSVVNTTAGESYTYVFQLCGDAGGVPGAGIIQVDSKGDAKKTTVIGMYNATQAFGGGKSVRRKPLCVSANWDYKRFYWLMYIMIPHLFLLNIVYDSLVKWQSFFFRWLDDVDLPKWRSIWFSLFQGEPKSVCDDLMQQGQSGNKQMNYWIKYM